VRTAVALLMLALLAVAPSARAADRCSAPGAKTLLANTEARATTVTRTLKR
jgi:16S rRNA C967 or C1407 C5-methylase (RsmB/RsmF family)